MITVYRGTGGGYNDTKNIGTYYTTSKEEAEVYGATIKEIEIETNGLMVVTEEELGKYIEEWLDSLDEEEREYQESTKAYFEKQMDEILAAEDAKKRGYRGVWLKDIRGEFVEKTDYIIIF